MQFSFILRSILYYSLAYGCETVDLKRPPWNFPGNSVSMEKANKFMVRIHVYVCVPLVCSKLLGLGERFCDVVVMWKQVGIYAECSCFLVRTGPNFPPGCVEVACDTTSILQTLLGSFLLLTFFANFIMWGLLTHKKNK